MAIEQDLQQIGLSTKEASTYLSLLELGPASVVLISRKSGLKRTTVYEVLDSLSQRGLVSETVFGRRVRYVAEPPEKFLELKKREMELLRGILPTLGALRNVSLERPAFRFYQGKDEVEDVFRDMIMNTDPKNDLILSIEAKASMVTAQLGSSFWIDLLAEKKKRALKSLALDAYTHEELNEFAKKYPWSVDHGIAVRTLGDPENLLNLHLYLYQNKVALVAPDQLIAIVIENQRVKRSFEFLFHRLWDSAKEWKNPFS